MIRILPMNESHVAAVAALEKICFSSPWSERSVEAELKNPLSCWLVAMEGEKLAGYIGSQTVMGEADMMNVAVDPSCRRQGIGRELVMSLIAALESHEAQSLTLEVRASNHAAIAMYDEIGFTQVGRRPNYYRAPKEDALILRKELCS